MATWTFLSNHAHVLVLLCDKPDMRIRDVALRVGITGRAVQRIIHDLVEEEYLHVEKCGRRNHYEPNLQATLRHPLEAGVTVEQFLRGVGQPIEPDAGEGEETWSE